MNYEELLQAARGQMGPCHACPVCNGRACGGNIPGPGAKGSGTVAIRNFDAWRSVRLNMDTIHENFTPDTRLQLFGRTFKYPFFAGPVGAMALHYGDKYNDMDYNSILVPACAAAGIAAFTGDGTNPKVMEGATAAIAANGGFGIPTVKPWDNATVAQKMAMARESGCFALAMDIDAAGLPFLQNLTPPAGSKTVEQLQEIAHEAGVPFILKGIMTAKGAEKAVQAGAAGIVVSNHGGRVLDDCAATEEVLLEIVAAVAGRAKVFVDGGVRTGGDVFRHVLARLAHNAVGLRGEQRGEHRGRESHLATGKRVVDAATEADVDAKLVPRIVAVVIAHHLAEGSFALLKGLRHRS